MSSTTLISVTLNFSAFLISPCVGRVLALLILFALPVAGSSQDSGTDRGFTLPGVSAAEPDREETEKIAREHSVQLKWPTQSPVVLCFWGTQCPLAKVYAPRLDQLARQYAGRVQFIGINSNRQDSMPELVEFVEKFRFPFPFAKDYQNRIADRFKVIRGPEVLLFNRDGEVVYRGRVDDQYSPGVSRSQPMSNYLVDAVEATLSGKQIEVARTKPVGCLIGRVKQKPQQTGRPEVTWCNQVTRILQKHCVECHRSGEIGPFEMIDYEEVVGWADMMLEVIEDERMPPWHANPKYGHFQNARIMEDAEKQALRDWVASGTPYGDPDALPSPRKFIAGWDLPARPDVVIPMRTKPYSVPAEGTVEYQYFVVDPGFKEDKWVKAAQVLPGNRSVVHHSIVFVRPPDGVITSGIGWLSAYVPGQRAFRLPANHARRIPAGSKLVFQQHYTPTGSVENDTTKIGLVFADDQEVTDVVSTIVGIDQEFEIPPQTSDYEVKASLARLPRTAKLLSVSPHMHLRGKSFRGTFRRPREGDSELPSKEFLSKGSPEEIFCDVPNYDFNWQHTYIFERPIDLSDVASIDFTVTFDNSTDNPVNPDPDDTVTWGDQTYEEMALAFFDVALPRDANKTPLAASDGLTQKRTQVELSPDSEEVLAFVDSFFKRFDKNRDGQVERTETPIAMQRFGFWRFDKDRNRKLSRDEILQAARSRIK